MNWKLICDKRPKNFTWLMMSQTLQTSTILQCYMNHKTDKNILNNIEPSHPSLTIIPIYALCLVCLVLSYKQYVLCKVFTTYIFSWRKQKHQRLCTNNFFIEGLNDKAIKRWSRKVKTKTGCLNNILKHVKGVNKCFLDIGTNVTY